MTNIICYICDKYELWGVTQCWAWGFITRLEKGWSASSTFSHAVFVKNTFPHADFAERICPSKLLISVKIGFAIISIFILNKGFTKNIEIYICRILKLLLKGVVPPSPSNSTVFQTFLVFFLLQLKLSLLNCFVIGLNLTFKGLLRPMTGNIYICIHITR